MSITVQPIGALQKGTETVIVLTLRHRGKRSGFPCRRAGKLTGNKSRLLAVFRPWRTGQGA